MKKRQFIEILHTLRDTFLSSLPLAIVMLVMCVFVAPMENALDYVKMVIGYVFVVVGQSMFLVGLEKSILPIGKMVGSSFIKLKKTIFIIFFGFLFGLVVTVAEPAIAVLARQAHMVQGAVNSTVFLWITGAGIGVFVGIALFRILKDINPKIMFAIMYAVVFLVVIFVPPEFVALSFDASGATTGDMSVPFILVLGLGISATMSKHKTTDDSFGVIGFASVGPILAVFMYAILLKLVYRGELPPVGIYNPGGALTLGGVLKENLWPVALTLIPIIILFLPFNFGLIKLPKREFIRILLATVPVYVGLLIFLSGIDFGLAFAGKYIGGVFFAEGRPDWFRWLLLVVGFILGASITMTEPSVAVLGKQLEELTQGHIKDFTIRFTLALGTGFATVLCLVKIITQVNILYFLVPLYAIALLLMIFTPKLFVGLAFDSGGVTGGALTSAFLTPLTLGVAQAVAERAGPAAQSVLTNGFGAIAFVSVTPLIAVQLLGIIYTVRSRKIQQQVEADEFEGLEGLMVASAKLGKAAEKNKPEPAKARKPRAGRKT